MFNRANGIAVINGGQIVSEACSKLPGPCYCYALRSAGKITINNAYVSGAHGGIGIEGGNAVINYVESETYVCSTAEDQIEDHSTHGDVTHYALYVVGEQTNVSSTVNGGKFKSNRLFAVLIGNNTPGDGGNRQKAFATITCREFTAGGNSNVIKIDGNLGYAYLYGGKYSNNNVTIGNVSTYYLNDICDSQKSVYQEGNWYVVISLIFVRNKLITI